MHELIEPTGNAELPVGTRVEVRDRFCAAWSCGFVVAAATPNAYRVRRVSDAYVLPVEFTALDLRPAVAR